jgi:asparagine synthase (glutamine-hydrolysing)
MCGINGFTGSDPSALRRMHAATKHRGPDDEGFFEEPGISLAHNRLSIIDLSPGGRQPMSSQDGRYTIVFNGEIYNYRELKSELEKLGEKFHTSSDTEVLIAAYARWGKECLPKLNGIFAFAIWDREKKKLTLVRDALGVKPLYYHWDGKRLAFSSEIKALLELGIPRTLNVDAMNSYFRLLYVPAPQTMFQEIQKLHACSGLTLENEKIEHFRWGKVTEGEVIPFYHDAVAGVRSRARDAVKRQLVSDRSLGVFLSGGVDSTAVLALMRDIDASGVIKTFTVGYEQTDEAEKYNADARLAALSAKHFGAEHHELTMTSKDVLGCLDDVAWHMDEPIANHVQTSTYLLAKFAKPTITVALGGDGGDELFGGYPRYWYAAMMDRFNRLPPAVQKSASALMHLAGQRDLVAKLRIPAGLERHLSFVMQKEAAVSALLRGSVNRPGAVRAALAPQFADTWKDQTNRLMAADIATWLPDESLARTDKVTMAHGLEERVPLLDIDLVTYSARIPSSWKVGSRSQGKRVFIDAMRDLLPSHVLNQEKRAWMSPMAKWIRGPLEPFVREVLSPSYNPETADLFDFTALNRVLDDHISKRTYALNTIWSVVTFQLWWKKFKPTF